MIKKHYFRRKLVVISLAIGTIVGELVGIEAAFERFGEWLKIKSGTDCRCYRGIYSICMKRVIDVSHI
ncbi:DUF554 family protein [Butyrivibrio sp. XPD2002]|uniref:DUF554 family protein n=1 Tax=Butyrivibrio sp. XPD2002 TaxID=1280665 RepID=UPI0009DC2DCE